MSGFRGGIHPNYKKITAGVTSEKAKIPKIAVLHLSQHVGAPASPIVKVGDKVSLGQKIAEGKSFISANIHASIPGAIKYIDKTMHPVTGKPSMSITIEGESGDEEWGAEEADTNKLSTEQIIEKVKEAGIVGLGGAAFPTHVKLSPPKDKKIDQLIINGAECEPYLTTDHRLMVEKADELIKGITLAKKVLGVADAVIGIEDNKIDAIKILKEKCSEKAIGVRSLHTKYPQGGEKNLIYSITKRKVPTGGLPMDIGCVVLNVGTAIAIYEAVALGKPLYERLITVTGRVVEPRNLIVRNGTLVSELIKECSGYKGEPKKIIMGGPMMGFALSTKNVPVIKGTSGIVVLNEQDIDAKRSTIECIRCGKCVENCPMQLTPNLISQYTEKGMIDDAEKLYAMDCFECGCCAFNCPSHIPLVHWIRYGKSQIMKNRVRK